VVSKNNAQLLAGGKTLPVEVARLLSAVSRSSSICFAMFDQDLRFRAVNQVTAATHAFSIEEHIGTDLRDIIGEVAVHAVPAIQQVLHSGHGSYVETSGRLPRQTYSACWVNHFFPVQTPRGKVQQVGVLAVEVTDLKNLDELYTNLTAQVLLTAQHMALLHELHGCIGEYKAALGLNLASLSHGARDPERKVEVFTDSMAVLDQRMTGLMSAVTACFPLVVNSSVAIS
jgi:hypothetical protein